MMALDRLRQVVRVTVPRSYPRFFRESDLLVVVDCVMDPTALLVAEHGTIDDTA
jgi:hypothetical protein